MTRPTWLALVDGEPAGFTDLEPDGHLDMMFVDPRFHQRGVATALVRRAEAEARRVGLREIFAEVSITARPFFERQGFSVVAPHPIELHGLVFKTWRMTKA